MTIRGATRQGWAAAPIGDVSNGTADRRSGRQPAEAEACLTRAIELARSRAERSHELRAATGLARLLAREHRPEEARAALGGIYAWFTEGLDTADLATARAVLEQLPNAPRRRAPA